MLDVQRPTSCVYVCDPRSVSRENDRRDGTCVSRALIERWKNYTILRESEDGETEMWLYG
jgi:hypothetical protein